MTPHTSAPTTARSAHLAPRCCVVGRSGLGCGLRKSPSPQEKGRRQEGALGHSCTLTAPQQVLQDYLQGRLLVSAQADTQLARLAALQHLSRALSEPPSE